MQERLQKILAAHGVASRRASEAMIASGKVTVNGHIAHLGDRADLETDDVRVNGQPVGIRLAPFLYLALNKPRGYVSTLRATHGEPTVMDLVDVPARVYPVGRLDKGTSGLLLFTNDGDWANIIMHPRFGLEKEYHARVQGRPSPATLDAIAGGVSLGDGVVSAACRVETIRASGDDTILRLTLKEGKKRQIRMMGSAVGHPVLDLHRVRVNGISVRGLAAGAWRNLSAQEVEEIRRYGKVGAGNRDSNRH